MVSTNGFIQISSYSFVEKWPILLHLYSGTDTVPVYESRKLQLTSPFSIQQLLPFPSNPHLMLWEDEGLGAVCVSSWSTAREWQGRRHGAAPLRGGRRRSGWPRPGPGAQGGRKAAGTLPGAHKARPPPSERGLWAACDLAASPPEDGEGTRKWRSAWRSAADPTAPPASPARGRAAGQASAPQRRRLTGAQRSRSGKRLPTSPPQWQYADRHCACAHWPRPPASGRRTEGKVRRRSSPSPPPRSCACAALPPPGAVGRGPGTVSSAARLCGARQARARARRLASAAVAQRAGAAAPGSRAGLGRWRGVAGVAGGAGGSARRHHGGELQREGGGGRAPLGRRRGAGRRGGGGWRRRGSGEDPQAR